MQIDGPWSVQDKALRLMRDLLDAAIDDEVMGHCEACECMLWASDDSWISSNDGVMQCRDCTDRLNAMA